jgi:hypothetical protein
LLARRRRRKVIGAFNPLDNGGTVAGVVPPRDVVVPIDRGFVGVGTNPVRPHTITMTR